MKCYKCGNDVDEGSIFCLCCGADLIDYKGGNNGKPPQENEKTEYEVIASSSGAEKTVRISENEANANKKSPYDPVKPDLGGQVFWQPSDDEKDKVNDKDKKNKGDSKKIVIGFIAGIAAALVAVLVVTKLIPAIKNNKKSSLPAYSDYKIGDIITFGSYEQDNNTSNGKEEIEWQVLAKEDNKILVISKYALDVQKYNTYYAYVTWESCSLRKWLNGTFLNNAFSSEEQGRIISTKVSADKNPKYSTNPGNATTDKVFLLSITEAEKYFTTDESRKCAPTAYAKAHGASTSDNYKSASGEATGFWWLRSPGYDQDYAAFVYIDGSVGYFGDRVDRDGDCVRPALWINLDS